MSDSNADFSNLWAVHSEREDRPAICDWAVSEDEAIKKKADLEGGADDQETKYWVTRMTKDEVEAFKASGFIPADA